MVRNTYFYGYIQLYLKLTPKVVMLDYLAIKVLAHLFINSKQPLQFASCLESLYQSGLNQVQLEDADKKMDFFNKWHKLIKILLEIVYSPQIEIASCISLRKLPKIQKASINMLAGVVKQCGKVSQQELDSLFKYFFNGCPVQLISETLTMNEQTNRYTVREELQGVEPFDFSMLVSLTHSDLNHLREGQRSSETVFNHGQQEVASALLGQSFMSLFFINQLKLVEQMELTSLFSTLPEVIRLTQTLTHLQLFSESDSFYQKCIELTNSILAVS